MYIKLTRLDNTPIWLNAAFIVTIEPRKQGGSIVVPIGDGLDYDVRETAEQVLAMLEGAPVAAVVPVPTPKSLAPMPKDVTPDSDVPAEAIANQAPVAPKTEGSGEEKPAKSVRKPRAKKAAADGEAKPARKTRAKKGTKATEETASVQQQDAAAGETASVQQQDVGTGETASVRQQDVGTGETASVQQQDVGAGETASVQQQDVGTGETASVRQQEKVAPSAKFVEPPRPKVDFSPEQIDRLQRMAPRSMRKLLNTLTIQFKVMDASAVVAFLREIGVIEVQQEHVVWK